MRRFALVLSTAIFAATGSLVAPPASAAPVPAVPIPAEPAAAEPASVPGQLLVGYRSGTSSSERANARSETGARLVERVVAGRGTVQEVELVALPSGADRDAAIRRFEQNPNVTYAEPNWIVAAEVEPSNDPYYMDGKLWGAHGDATSPANQYGSQAGEAWAGGNHGAGAVIGVIDTGVDISHPDLAANVWTNTAEIAGDGVDNDSNGYVDDVNGWDFFANDGTVYDAADGDEHGTHVAGTIAAVGGNSMGTAGVAWDAKVVPVKFLGPNGGTTANAIKAVDYLTALKKKGVNVVASNNSWGGGGFSQALYDAIQRASDADIVFAAAAGNGGSDRVGDDTDQTPHYPSSYTNNNVISVASLTSSGDRSSFSNYGDASVDLGAPGSSIWSTVPGNAYDSYSGTSMATPHVTGGVALVAAAGISGAAAIKQQILGTATATQSLAGLTLTGGRLDLSGFGGTPVPVVNTAPTVANDSYSTKRDTALTVSAPGALGNDTDAQGDQLTATISEPPPLSTGTVSLNANGGFTYTPAGGFAGDATFTYVANDGQADSLSATVMITVTAPTTKTKGGGKPSSRGTSTQ